MTNLEQWQEMPTVAVASEIMTLVYNRCRICEFECQHKLSDCYKTIAKYLESEAEE